MRHFRTRAEEFLTAHPRVKHRWSASGEFTYLEILNDDPTAFSVRANVSPELAVVLADGNVDRAWQPRPGDDQVAMAEELVTFLTSLLGPTVRLREVRRGRRTARWVLERRRGAEWERIAQRFALNPLSYLGRRSELVRRNRLVHISAQAV